MPNVYKKEKRPEPDKPKEGGTRGAVKANRAAKRRSHYAANPARGAANKKRKLGNRLRSFPDDLQAEKHYIELYGEASAFSHRRNLTSRGRKWHRRPMRAPAYLPKEERGSH